MDYQEVQKVLEEEDNLIRLDTDSRTVFVGDTHGDLGASQEVFEKYFDDETRIVFLGDYIDRGPQSRENLNFLLNKKVRYPHRVFLLQGNHEGYKFARFRPVDFWSSLSSEERKTFEDLLGLLPLVLVQGKVIALHGGLPNVQGEEDILQISPGDEQWKKITWGDFVDEPGYSLGSGMGRPQLGRDYFQQVMKQLGKKVLIRSHQPHVPVRMFDSRCITVFTSSAYGTGKRVAIVSGEVEEGREVLIETL